MAIRAVDVDFVEEREGDAVVVGAKLLYFFVGAGFLLAKLVAREAQNSEALAFVFLLDRF